MSRVLDVVIVQMISVAEAILQRVAIGHVQIVEVASDGHGREFTERQLMSNWSVVSITAVANLHARRGGLRLRLLVHQIAQVRVHTRIHRQCQVWTVSIAWQGKVLIEWRSTPSLSPISSCEK